jgi:hypothetical protein
MSKATFTSVLTAVFLWGVNPSAPAQSVPDYAVLLSATVQTNPAQITLSWPADALATNYTLYRKNLTATSWGAATTLATNASNYTDTNVAVGGAFEYRVSKAAWTGTTSYTGDGYIYAGIQVPLVESRGKVILVADNTFTTNLAMELNRLEQDLAGDGWIVLRHDVARMAVDPANTSSNVWAVRAAELANVKALIKADYNADPSNVKAVFLFGHVPVPYSGNLAPDGHPDHLGAWPADAYYGDMTGTWTDSTVNTSGNSTIPSDTRNWNLPGDGKFDQSLLPANVTLQVGRVDFANLPAFSTSEGELLRQYLNKDHYFRHKFVTTQRRGLIDDNFGTFNGEAFAASGWRNFAPFFGATNIVSGDWLTMLAGQSFLWGYGCGGGTYTSADGVGTTAEFAAADPQVVFTMLFGSYFGDWDSQDNFLRAPLAAPTYTLTCAWSGRPYWEFHPMALGQTIGFGAQASQNNSTTYSADTALHWVHIALMGDPTLRMHVVAPPSSLAVSTNGSGGVTLNWNASADAVAGYHVYRAATVAGPFTRLTSSLLTGTTYTDTPVSSNVYMVRAVKLEVSASGSYYNPSQGVFQSLDPTFAAPAIFLFQPTNNTIFPASAVLQLGADIFDPANSITNVAFYANAVKIGGASTPPYTLVWSNVAVGAYALTASAFSSNGPVTNSAGVMVLVDNGGSPLLTIAPLTNGAVAIGGKDVLGRAYRIQYVPTANSTNWQTLGIVTSNAPGSFQFIDPAGLPPRFYRSIFP